MPGGIGVMTSPQKPTSDPGAPNALSAGLTDAWSNWTHSRPGASGSVSAVELDSEQHHAFGVGRLQARGELVTMCRDHSVVVVAGHDHGGELLSYRPPLCDKVFRR